MLKAMLVLAALTSPGAGSASSTQADYAYDFPGCNGGGGNWPAMKLNISPKACAESNGENLLSYTGHCNGRIVLSAQCAAGEIQLVDVVDCFCD